MRVIGLSIAAGLLLSSSVFAEDSSPRKTITKEHPVEVCQTVLILWDSTANAVAEDINHECYPATLEGLHQLEKIFKVCEIANFYPNLPKAIAARQEARRAQLKELMQRAIDSPKSNKGCPKRSMPGTLNNKPDGGVGPK